MELTPEEGKYLLRVRCIDALNRDDARTLKQCIDAYYFIEQAEENDLEVIYELKDNTVAISARGKRYEIESLEM